MTTLTATTTHADGQYTETLDLSSVPAPQLHHIIELGNIISEMLGSGVLIPAEDDDTDADEMVTDFTKAMAVLWREHAVRQ